jgi:hypothetical protein
VYYYIKYTTCEYLTLEQKQCVVLYKVYYMLISKLKMKQCVVLYKVCYMWISKLKLKQCVVLYKV